MRGLAQRDTLHLHIKDASQDLLRMARDHSYNRISDNLVYIISKPEQEVDQSIGFFDQYKQRKKNNDAKSTLTFDAAIKHLVEKFNDIYEIDLYVYKATHEKTIIEIGLIEKNSDYRKAATHVPLLHNKVCIPPYALNPDIPVGEPQLYKKFDINWQLNTLNHRWEMFCWVFKARRNLRRLEKRKEQ
jgi:hypothetical protein